MGPSTAPYGLPWDLASNLKYQQTLANRDSGVLARVSIQVNRAFYQAQVQLICNYRWKVEKVGGIGRDDHGQKSGLERFKSWLVLRLEVLMLRILACKMSNVLAFGPKLWLAPGHGAPYFNL